MARIVPIATPERLDAALELFERVWPGALARSERDRRHFAGLLADASAGVLLGLEDRDSMVGAFLGSDRDRTGTLYFDIAVDPTADVVGVGATLAEAGREAASVRAC